MEIHDHIVVGSGCTGAMAAQTLVEEGVKVTMVDVGIADNKYNALIPDKDFLSIRAEEKDQYKYLIGEDAEGVSWGKIKTGEHLTPSRKHVLKLVNEYLPLISESFKPMESLAYGGLGNAWGLGCCEFSEAEAKSAGLNYNDLSGAYKVISKRIGISGAKDDASKYTIGNSTECQSAINIDNNHNLLLNKYSQKKEQLNRKGFFMGRPALALLTEDQGNRKKYAYRDMDFYSDKDESAYRPWITVNELRKKNNFQYISGLLVTRFEEKENFTEVHCYNVEEKINTVLYCKKLILAPGVLGTARIVLRSQSNSIARLPLLCNPYSYIPCIQPLMVGRDVEKYKPGFAQLSLFHDPKGDNYDVAMASIYSYQSLMLFRIIKEAPLNFNDARILMRYLMPGFLIMGLHHPEKRGENKYVEMVRDKESITGDKMKAVYINSSEEKKIIRQRESLFTAAMRKMGAFSIRKINPGAGSSIHYAGTLPFSDKNELFRISPSGKLNGSDNVYIADGSGFRYLPAKGLTYSLMANAHLTALNVLKNE